MNCNFQQQFQKGSITLYTNYDAINLRPEMLRKGKMKIRDQEKKVLNLISDITCILKVNPEGILVLSKTELVKLIDGTFVQLNQKTIIII